MSRPLPHRVPLLALAALCVALALPASAAAIGPLSSFGGFGSAAGQLNGPEGLELDAAGNVYVAEYSNNRISVFTAAGTFVRAFGKGVGGPGVDVCTVSCQSGTFDYPASAAAGALSTPVDVALDAAGRVFVADQLNSRVDVFDSTGSFLYAFGKEVKAGGGGDKCTAATGCQGGFFSNISGAFFNISGLAISGSRLYAADAENNRVDVFDLDGNFIFAFGRNVGGSGVHTCTTSCQMGSTEGLAAIDNPVDVAVAPGGNVYVAANGNQSGFAVFTADGAYIDRYAEDEGDPGFLNAPRALAITPGGLVQATEVSEEEVKTYSAAGAFLSSFPAPDVTGLALDCRGSIWTTAYDASLVVRYGEPGAAPPPCSPPPVATPILVTVTPSNVIRFGKLKRNKQKGTATLTVNLPSPGRLVLKGNGLVKVTKTPTAAGAVKLAIKPKGKVKKKLNEVGKAVAKAKLTFTPTGGAAATKQKSLTLKKLTG